MYELNFSSFKCIYLILASASVQERLRRIYNDPVFNLAVARAYDDMVENPDFDEVASKIVSRNANDPQNVLLDRITPDRITYLTNAYKSNPNEFARELLKDYYQTEEELASMSISGTGGKRVTKKIPRKVLDAVCGTLKIFL